LLCFAWLFLSCASSNTFNSQFDEIHKRFLFLKWYNKWFFNWKSIFIFFYCLIRVYWSSFKSSFECSFIWNSFDNVRSLWFEILRTSSQTWWSTHRFNRFRNIFCLIENASSLDSNSELYVRCCSFFIDNLLNASEIMLNFSEWWWIFKRNCDKYMKTRINFIFNRSVFDVINLMIAIMTELISWCVKIIIECFENLIMWIIFLIVHINFVILNSVDQ
jgi:hypothetical protein